MRKFFVVVLLLLISATITFSQQTIPYGNNPSSGKYLTVKDGTKLYYEVYGTGEPLVLLHGGVYGYIDEFTPFIDKLKNDYQVICLATRGHGKSEVGKNPYTFQQRAEDAYELIKSLTRDSVTVLGFSDGGFSAFKLAALYPSVVKKMIVIGASDRPKDGPRQKAAYSTETLMKNNGAYFKDRLALMPDPNKWEESLQKLNKLYNEDYISTETFQKIKCPVLVMSGDRDGNHSVEQVNSAAKSIQKSQLSIIPGCDHVVFFCNFPAVWEAIVPFLKNN